jgi:hypothetical protein
MRRAAADHSQPPVGNRPTVIVSTQFGCLGGGGNWPLAVAFTAVIIASVATAVILVTGFTVSFLLFPCAARVQWDRCGQQ